MYEFIYKLFVGFFCGLIASSFIEHTIHRYLLHNAPKSLRNNKYFRSMWKGHAISHHGSYAPDDHYTQDDTNKAEVLTFSWYEGPLIILTSTGLVYGIAVAYKFLVGIPFNPIIPEVIGAGMAFTLYYVAYESLHAIMHVPNKWKWLSKTRFMLWLNRHHYQHHLDPNTNLNVILPIADYVLSTKRSLPKDKHKYVDSFYNMKIT